MVSIKRWCIALVALAMTAPGVGAQEDMQEAMGPEAMAERPIPAGVYTFVAEESEDIGPRAREAVSHLFFAIRGIARRRLVGANKPIDRLDISYAGDTLLVSLREDEPVVKSLMTGVEIPYTREDGEVVQVKADVGSGMIDMYFTSDDGEKEMIFTFRDDGKIALESISYSDKLREPFRYTWVYAPTS